jgi:SagB-type dehydrogenase family enzyme
MLDPKESRRFLKANWKEWSDTGQKTDQQKGVPRPAPEKPFAADAKLIDLVAPDKFTVGDMPLRQVIAKRESRRAFTSESLTLEELSFLVWATQGVRAVERVSDGATTRRTVPSGGCRHAFETYLYVNRVDGVAPGLYRYLPIEHKLLPVERQFTPEQVGEACCGQGFVGEGAVVFIWTVIPYRMEWRYTTRSHKVIAIDAGHLCQNLYLAAEAVGGGTCAIGAYYQDEMDALLGLDGEDEFVIYAAPVGKIEL